MKLIEDTNIPAQTNWVDDDGPIPEPAEHLFLRRLKAESDSYTPVAGENDVTSMTNFIDYANYKGYDYIWKQLRVEEIVVSDTWAALSNSDKDLVIYYNQYKQSEFGSEDSDKVTHLITTGQAPDVPAASAFLKKTHSESIGRARPSIIGRVDGDRVVNTIITYLNPADTTQLLNTIQTHLIRYKEYAMVGTIIWGAEEGLRDYIESTGPTYTLNGLIEEGWVTQNPPKTLSDLRDDLVNILFGNNDIVI